MWLHIMNIYSNYIGKGIYLTAKHISAHSHSIAHTHTHAHGERCANIRRSTYKHHRVTHAVGLIISYHFLMYVYIEKAIAAIHQLAVEEHVLCSNWTAHIMQGANSEFMYIHTYLYKYIKNSRAEREFYVFYLGCFYMCLALFVCSV